jgi:dihydropteroate synthase
MEIPILLIMKYLKQVEKMLSEGAHIIDIGACSTRPGANLIDENTELKKINHAVKLLTKEFPSVVISIDTFRANVAYTGIGEGALLINDVSGGEMDNNMFETVAKCKVPYILMHMRGTPETMQSFTHYENMLIEISRYFNEKINKLQKLGVTDVIIDPGFGFAKTIDQNFELLKRLHELLIFEKPILAGISRKSTIYKTLNSSPQEALNGTTVLNTIALLNGANILRVHDIKEAVECVKLVEKTIKNA